jgi:hypothetical protein
MNTDKSGEVRIASLSTLGEPMPETNGFDRFWQAWPSSPRKGAKSECLKKWVKLKCDLSTDQILKHLEWMKTTEQWKKGNGAFIPAPLVYLNQQRWDGAEIPEPPPPPSQFRSEALVKIEQDRQKAAPMPAEIRAKIAELLGKRHDSNNIS